MLDEQEQRGRLLLIEQYTTEQARLRDALKAAQDDRDKAYAEIAVWYDDDARIQAAKERKRQAQERIAKIEQAQRQTEADLRRLAGGGVT